MAEKKHKLVPKKNSLLDNCKRFKRILYRKKSYMKISWHAIKKNVPISELARTQLPFLFPLAPKPVILGVEFTNTCNLDCVYCKYPDIPQHERGFMEMKVFKKILKEIDRLKVNRIIIGGGEATLHPKFDGMVRRLSEKTKFISIVTNGQWTREDIPVDLIMSHIDLIEISVDAGGKENYEASRKGASFDKLIQNLKTLKAAREKCKSSTLINIRLMMRPSKEKSKKKDIKLLSQYADTVMIQPILKFKDHDYHQDIFIPSQNINNKIPKCKRPFNNLIVKYNGDIPLCAPSYNQHIIGNINTHSLTSLWKSKTLQQYRKGIKKNCPQMAPDCMGCCGT